jgi:hypothetical protein
MNAQTLPWWRDTPARAAIVEFVERVTSERGADCVPTSERVATFDNDGTLWCEKPLPIQANFLFRRLAEMATSDPSLASRQPWKGGHREGLRVARRRDHQALRRRRQ